jgi:hypothetical protein
MGPRLDVSVGPLADAKGQALRIRARAGGAQSWGQKYHPCRRRASGSTRDSSLDQRRQRLAGHPPQCRTAGKAPRDVVLPHSATAMRNRHCDSHAMPLFNDRFDIPNMGMDNYLRTVIKSSAFQHSSMACDVFPVIPASSRASQSGAGGGGQSGGRSRGR